MSKTYCIEGRPVSGKNSTQIRVNRKTGGRFVTTSEAAKGWQAEAIAQLCNQRGRTRTIYGPVFVEYVAYQTADVCDIDNMESALFDALKKARVIEDDKLIQDHRGRKAIDTARPRIEVTVSAITEAA